MSLNSKTATKLRFLASRQVQKLKRLKDNQVVLLRGGLKLQTIV